MDWSKEFLRFLKDPYQSLAWETGFKLRGLNLRWKETTVLLVVKVEGRLDGNKVAFIEAESAIEALHYLYLHCTTTAAPLKFRPDKWP